MSASDGRLAFDVRVWKLEVYKGARKTSYRARWSVEGKRFARTFQTRKLAESFRANLLTASTKGEGFGLSDGLPQSLVVKAPPLTWFAFAQNYAREKWPEASPRHRKGIAEALTGVTVALIEGTPGRPEGRELRAALTSAFNMSKAAGERVRPVHDAALAWVRRASPPVSVLAEPATVRRVLRALGTTLTGDPAAASTLTRKRATFNNALEYAVELDLLPNNTLRRLRSTSTPKAVAVDRRVVVNPTQARLLLDAVRERDPALLGFFGCLYYAGMRPAEARNIRARDLHLPETGWGKATLTGSHQYSGRDWTDSGAADEERGLKHRPKGDTRRVPLHPELVEILLWHLKTFGTGAEGRLFVARTGRAGVPLSPPFHNPVAPNTIYRAFSQARARAFTPEQAASPLARRPYDLRHAAVSTWLNSGVDAPQVAEWAGHSTDVLLRIYAKCIDGQEAQMLDRIDRTMRGPDAT